MAITPRSKGLGNIGSIVNRQRLAAPTRPAAKPAPKPVAKMPVPKPVTTKANPFAGGKTTTMAQRQVMSPFNSAAKPVNKIDPLAGQPATQMPIQPATQFNPTAPPDTQYRGPELPPPTGQPFNPFNPPGGYTPGLPYYIGSGPDLGSPTPMPGSSSGIVDLGNGMSIVPDFGGNTGDFANPGYTGPGISNDFGPGEMINQYGFPDMSNQPVNTPGGGIFGGNLLSMVGNAVGQGLGGMFGGPITQPVFGFSEPTGEFDPTKLGTGPMNPLQSAFNPTSNTNTNNNNSGSLFGGGGFAGQ